MPGTPQILFPNSYQIRGRHQHPHFMDNETETWNNCSRSHSQAGGRYRTQNMGLPDVNTQTFPLHFTGFSAAGHFNIILVQKTKGKLGQQASKTPG